MVPVLFAHKHIYYIEIEKLRKLRKHENILKYLQQCATFLCYKFYSAAFICCSVFTVIAFQHTVH